MKSLLLLCVMLCNLMGVEYENNKIDSNYGLIFNNALNGDGQSIVKFLRHGLKTDGSYSEEYCSNLVDLFKKVGDEKMAKLIDNIDEKVKKKILSFMVYELSNERNKQDGKLEFKVNYPKCNFVLYQHN